MILLLVETYIHTHTMFAGWWLVAKVFFFTKLVIFWQRLFTNNAMLVPTVDRIVHGVNNDDRVLSPVKKFAGFFLLYNFFIEYNQHWHDIGKSTYNVSIKFCHFWPQYCTKSFRSDLFLFSQQFWEKWSLKKETE